MRKIGVFDSGVGGISVLKEVLKELPNDDIVYFGDSLNAPYGDRPLKEIIELCLKVSDFLVYEKKVDALVIACNTATGAAMNLMVEKYDIPVVGVIKPGAKEALKKTIKKNIAVLATPATVKMGVYKDELLNLDKNLVVQQIPCPHFVKMIENGWIDSEESDNMIKNYLGFLSKKTDTIILGCTHYPLIKRHIEKFYKGTIVDPAKETALTLKEKIGVGDKKKEPIIEFFVSGDIEKFKKISEEFLERKIDHIYKKILG